MKLVIVESPSKAKTIAKYLGNGFIVDASAGHIRDLPAKELGVDIKDGFKPKYVLTTDSKKKELIKRLQTKSNEADLVILATDPDREGEAISWHLQHVLKLKDNYQRIVFHEITKTAITNAMNNPRKINMDLVNAQQARRILDRLVGYKLSPVLCKKIQSKLSAGRVQSAALRMIVEREKEITAFIPEEYWNIIAHLSNKAKEKLNASLIEYKNKKLKISNQEQCEKILKDLNGADYIVADTKTSITKTNALPPFTTSTLQQDASIRLGFSTTTTMKTAQELYEGIDIKGTGHTALITYMRTDSVRISVEAINAVREYISNKYGVNYLPENPIYYKSKKSSQDAHECIRPIDINITPDSVKDKLNNFQYKLYKIIYERFLACQCAAALYDSLTAIINANDYSFKTSGRVLKFDGFTKIYNNEKPSETDDKSLPNLTVGEKLTLNSLTHEQKFTKPASRYTEASLIKAMEEHGIGRPSTYSTIISTLTNRVYVTKEEKFFVPTPLGTTVTDYLIANFNDIVNIEFTAILEDKLDTIEESGVEWEKIVSDFYLPFEKQLIKAGSSEKMEVQLEDTDEVCEKCNSPMKVKMGRYGKYLACTNYPECSNIKSLKKSEPPQETDILCDLCGSKMLLRKGKYGDFIACSNYPKCKNTKNVNADLGKCPQCGGDIVKKHGKGKSFFYGCSKYPECKYTAKELENQGKQ